MGFEPMVECYPHTRLAGERLQPTRPSLPKNMFKRLGIAATGCKSLFSLAYPPDEEITVLILHLNKKYTFCLPQRSLRKLYKIVQRFYGGGSRIRTHGGVNLNGFQDRRFRPLSHPSIF